MSLDLGQVYKQPLISSPGNQNSLSVHCILSFGRCVASLALQWLNCTCVVNAKEERCEGEEMGRKETFSLQFLSFAFHHACTVPPLQCQRGYAASKDKGNQQKREYWFPCDLLYKLYHSITDNLRTFHLLYLENIVKLQHAIAQKQGRIS